MATSDKKVVAGLAYEKFVNSGRHSRRCDVIFLHGMMCSKEIWTDLPQLVADGSNRIVYTYDARNHGENEHSDDYTLDMNVSDLWQFMDALNISGAALVGHDMGGITALHAALENPDRVEMVFIIDMYVKNLPDELIDESIEFLQKWSEALETIDKKTPLKDVPSTVVPILFRNLSTPVARRRQREYEERAYLQANLRYKESDKGYKFLFNEGALTKALANLKVYQKEYIGVCQQSAFFLYGTESQYNVLSEEETIRRHFPISEMVKYDEASHFLFVDCPNEFVNRLVNCLNHPILYNEVLLRPSTDTD